MNKNLFLSQSTIEKLSYYVYVLVDPRNKKVFYVGKGKGNRINQHLIGALENKTLESEKIKIIREIQKENLDVGLEIIRHELLEKEAFEVESSLIDFIGLNNLTNLQGGHHSNNKGKMTLDEIKIKYEAEKVVGFDEPMILININRKFINGMASEEILSVTKGNWYISRVKARAYKYVAAVYVGIVREIFVIDKWTQSHEPKRSFFDGEIAPKEIRKKYINKSVSEYWKQGSQNPIKYVGSP